MTLFPSFWCPARSSKGWERGLLGTRHWQLGGRVPDWAGRGSSCPLTALSVGSGAPVLVRAVPETISSTASGYVRE